MTDDATLLGQRAVGMIDPQADADEEAKRRRQQLLALLRGRWHWGILLALLIAPLGGYAGWMLVDLEYASTGIVRVSPTGRALIYRTDQNSDMPQYESYLEYLAAMMSSQNVIEQAVQTPEWKKAGGGSGLQSLVAFRRNLSVDRPRRQQILEVTFYHENKEMAVAGAHSAIDAFVRLYGQQRTEEENQDLYTLEQRRNQLRKEADALRAQKQIILKDYGSAGLEQQYLYNLSEFMKIKAIIQQTQAMIRAAEGEDASARTMTPAEIATRDPQMREMLLQQQSLQSMVQRNAQLYGENHRVVVQSRADLDMLNRQIEQYARNYAATGSTITGIPGDEAGLVPTPTTLSLQELKARLREYEDLYAKLDEEMTVLGNKQRAVAELEDQSLVVEKRLEVTEERIDALNLEGSGGDTRIEVLSKGDVPTEPWNEKKRTQLALMGSVGGAGFGFSLVLLFGLLDSRFRRVDDTTVALPGTRLLGILPTLPDDLKDPEQAAVAAHCVHHIRTLLQLGPSEKGRVIAITSPSPGSGKTSLATALGLSFATSSEKTLLIDCDVLGGGLSRRLGTVIRKPVEEVLLDKKLISRENVEAARDIAAISNKSVEEVIVERGYASEADIEQARARDGGMVMGLLDACQGEPFDACVADGGLRNLYVLPLGNATPQQVSALSPHAISKVLKQARDRFDAIIIDTGPILGSIEAAMVVAEADANVLIISRGDQKSLVHRSLDHLKALHANVSGVVFNHASTRDVERSSYASVTSGPARLSETMPDLPSLDASVAARLGPMGSAVARCSQSAYDRNGSAASNGHSAHYSGNGTG